MKRWLAPAPGASGKLKDFAFGSGAEAHAGPRDVWSNQGFRLRLPRAEAHTDPSNKGRLVNLFRSRAFGYPRTGAEPGAPPCDLSWPVVGPNAVVPTCWPRNSRGHNLLDLANRIFHVGGQFGPGLGGLDFMPLWRCGCRRPGPGGPGNSRG